MAKANQSVEAPQAETPQVGEARAPFVWTPELEAWLRASIENLNQVAAAKIGEANIASGRKQMLEMELVTILQERAEKEAALREERAAVNNKV